MLNLVDQNVAEHALRILSDGGHTKDALLDRIGVLTAISSLSAIARHEDQDGRHILYVPKGRWETKLLKKTSESSPHSEYAVMERNALLTTTPPEDESSPDIIIVETE